MSTMTWAYWLIAHAALAIGLDAIAEWAARKYRMRTGDSAFDDGTPH